MVGRPFNPTVVDPSRFQPLALSYTVDASGAVIPGAVQTKLTPFWGSVQPFSLQPSDMNPARPGVYLDPGEPPLLNGAGDAAYRAGHEDVLLRSSWLTPDDGVLIDISPAAMGANTLGADDGAGRPLNPVTGAPYTPNIVKRGDWTRSLAEFWADGPTSSTPPGHWNEIANAVAAHPGFVRRLGGTGPELGPLEWDVKMYLALNGALHDVAVTVWGIKGHYDAMRPIGAIRTLAQYGQSSDPTQPSFHPNGLGLVPGTVEVITAATTAAGERHAALAGFEGQIAVRSWPGVPANPATEHSGVQWMLAGQWLPYQRPNFVTPAFAGYVSGHSTFSRAAADMLTHLSGSPFFPGGVAIYDCEAGNFLVFEDGPSQTLEFQWATYADASDNSGQSRIYGGIHPSFDDYPGRVIGAQVAGKAFARALDLFTPLSEPCRADLDADGTVDASDLALVLVAWGTADARCDFDTNGVVSGEDLATVLIHWGGCR